MNNIADESNDHDPLNNVTSTPLKDKSDENTHGGYSPAHTHLKTYTAGEDNSRLAAAAKELGLSMQQARQPRKQVRQRLQRHNSNSMLHNTAVAVQHLFTDTSLEDARMRAIYSAHAERHFLYEGDGGDDDSEAGRLFRTSLPEYQMATVLEDGGGDGEGGPAVDEHGVEIGGDLVSACTGTYRITIVYRYRILLGGWMNG
jgi:hypothetical protein